MRRFRIMHHLHVGMMLLLLLFIIVPFFPLLLFAFSSRLPWPNLLPETWSFRAWEYVLSPTSGTWSAVATSMLIAIVVTVINLIVAIPAVDALSRYRFRGRAWAEIILYAPIVIPAFVSVMGLHSALIRLGLTETMMGVVLGHIPPSLPYMLRALMTSFNTLSFEWEEQGRMLGAGRLKRFRYIVLPHLMPGIIAGVGLSMLVSLSQYLITFLIGGGRVVTIPILLFPFASSGDPTIAAAYTIVFAGLAVFALWGLELVLGHFYRKR